MNILENRYTNNPWFKRMGNATIHEEAPEATFEKREGVYESKVDLVGEDDDDEDRREGRTPPRATDSQGILLSAKRKKNTWLDDYDGTGKLKYSQYFI